MNGGSAASYLARAPGVRYLARASPSFKTISMYAHNWNGVWGRGCDEADVSEKKALSLNEGKAFSE